MTLGPAIIGLAFFESRVGVHGFVGRVREFFVTFGRVPLFFYLLMWFTAHLIAVLLNFAFGKSVHWHFKCRSTGSAHPLCKWFAGVKQRRRDWWLSYI